jgi:hypothetical protein
LNSNFRANQLIELRQTVRFLRKPAKHLTAAAQSTLTKSSKVFRYFSSFEINSHKEQKDIFIFKPVSKLN